MGRSWVLVVLLFPGAAAQSCLDAPEIRWQPPPVVDPLGTGKSTTQIFSLEVECHQLDAVEDVGLRVWIQDAAAGFSIRVADPAPDYPTGTCPASGWWELEIPVTVTLAERVEAGTYPAQVAAAVLCNDGNQTVSLPFEVAAAYEPGFRVESENQSIEGGQNKNLMAAFRLVNEGNAPIQVSARVKVVSVAQLDALLPPAMIVLPAGHVEPQYTDASVTVRTTHENGEVDYYVVANITFEARLDLAGPEAVSSPVKAEVRTLTVHVTGSYIPSPAALMVLVALAFPLWVRRRRPG